MFRVTATGMICLALATLGTGIPHNVAQAQEGETDLIVIEGKINATEVPVAENGQVGKTRVEGDGKLVEIQIGSDGPIPAGVRSEVQVDTQGIESRVLFSEDGKIIERRTLTAPGPTGTVRLNKGPQVADPEARAEIDKLIARLDEEVRKLQAEGKPDQAEKKSQSIRALKQLLADESRIINARTRLFRGEGAAAQAQEDAARARQGLSVQLGRVPAAERQEAVQRLAARRHELAAEIAKVPEQDREQRALLGGKIAELDRLLTEEKERITSPRFPAREDAKRAYTALGAQAEAERQAVIRLKSLQETLANRLSQSPELNTDELEKIRTRIAELEKQIAERKDRIVQFTPLATPQPPAIATFTALPALPQPPVVNLVEKGPGDRIFHGRQLSPEMVALSQKVQALRQAAEALSRAGIEDQARELRNAAEKIQKEIEVRRAEMAARPDAGAPLGLPVVPPHELHRSIWELTEQVQQLRKEVAEVRELLQRRQ